VRRGSFVQLGLYAVAAAAITTAVAVFIPWLPPEGSREAGRIAFTFWFMTGISIFVFAIVAAVLAFAVVNFRVKEGDLSDGPPVHGHTGLEIAWTAVPFVLVTAVAVVSAIVLAKNTRAGNDPTRVTVIAQQFAWQFEYPNKVTTTVLRLPLYRHVQLTLTAKDVLHSFWVPQLYQKQDAVPGLPTHLMITPTRVGTFPVICVELCGLGHSTMRSEVIVMKAADYDKWYSASKNPPAAAGGGGGGGGGAASALATFNGNGCSSCHTFAPAKAVGKIGPDLDNLKAEAAKAGKPVEAFIKESIEDPNAYIAPGYQKGVMPPFKGTITGDKLDQLVQYLAQNAK
jgi:cytochrome c oxidase subunit 2